MKKVNLVIAVIALATSVGIWYYLIRSVPQLHQNGTIQNIEFLGKQKVERTELRKTTSYTLPDRFVYTIKLDDGKIVRYEENALHAEADPDYKKSAKLSVTYQIRALPFGKEKTLVLEIESAN